ncbi:chemotaxis protein CheW [Pontixanthobacter aquaemixtae]|uniref:Chemotaxis protein CheW n=1 Tax=Pontixanthobacter aquaemixtae TaxID=1958940 RepID=A0A844ZRD5_9SPHN|nr:chemotaxis protein CheW [Pontixanthobacter aquaemixtae]MXO89367.1 chemotaxis protein CheW [Pontixanthobacter aquaemixtae]
MTGLLVMVDIAGRRAAIPAAEVNSVIELEKVYPIPRAPDYVTGLSAMRSQSLTVVDCRKALGLQGESDAAERAPVVDIDGHLYALLVDAVDDVAEAQSEITAVAGGFGKNWQRVAHGMVETADGPALVIDVRCLIEGPPAVAA